MRFKAPAIFEPALLSLALSVLLTGLLSSSACQNGGGLPRDEGGAGTGGAKASGGTSSTGGSIATGGSAGGLATGGSSAGGGGGHAMGGLMATGGSSASACILGGGTCLTTCTQGCPTGSTLLASSGGCPVSESNAVCGARCCVPSGHGGHGGAAGQVGQVGQGGAGGVGGAASPCSVIAKLDRACLSNDDCFSARHTSNCCGQVTFLGLNVDEKATYNANEPACDASYPLCECATLPPLLDDGSRIRSDQTPAVACLKGICTTFVKDCGGPCGTGKTCFTCGNRNGLFAACTTSCGTSADCADTSLPHCQSAQSGNVAGMFCTPASVLCDSK